MSRIMDVRVKKVSGQQGKVKRLLHRNPHQSFQMFNRINCASKNPEKDEQH